MKDKRFSDAFHIIQGAVNPIAVTRSLNEAVQEVWSATGDMDIVRKDPAVRLIAFQLAHIFNLHEYEKDVLGKFDADYRMVEEKAKEKTNG